MALIKQILHKTQGTAARTLDKLPSSVQEKIAKKLGYHYDFDGLNSFYKCLLASQHLQNKHGFIEDDYQKSRRVFQLQMQSLIKKPTSIKSVKDIVLDLPNYKLSARHYHPHPNKALPLIIFYHGGGWIVGDLNTHDEACRLLAKYANAQILSIDYPLAPEHGPTQIIGACVEALEWTYNNAQKLNILNKKIAVAGDSAGGNISAVVSQKTQFTVYAPSAQFLIYPAIDFKEKYPSFYKFKEGLILCQQDIDTVYKLYPDKYNVASDDPTISPIYGDLKKVAPAYVLTSGFDILHDEGKLYADKLKEAGVKTKYFEASDQPHGFINFTMIHKVAKEHLIAHAKGFKAFWESI